MAKKDRIVFRPRRAVPADAIAPAIARGPHPAGSGDHDQGRIDDRNTARIVPIGQGKFGVIRAGVRPDGRILAPMMPWRAYAGLTKSDAASIVEYLKSLRRSVTRFQVRLAWTRSRQYSE
jgi:hypothetical protein